MAYASINTESQGLKPVRWRLCISQIVETVDRRWPEGILRKDKEVDFEGSLQNFTIVQLRMKYRDSSGYNVISRSKKLDSKTTFNKHLWFFGRTQYK